MLQLQCRDEITELSADDFHLLIDGANGCVAKLVIGPGTLDGVGVGEIVAELFLLSSCGADGRPDYSYDATAPIMREVSDGAVVEITSSSSIWLSKKYVLHCTKEKLEYYYQVHGTGYIDNCEFFQGFVGNKHDAGPGKPWVNVDYECGSYGRVRSKALFPFFFNPEPNGLRKQYFSPNESSTIGVRSNKSYCRGNWFFTPGPFCYALKAAEKWLAVGLLVKPGHNNFVEYEYRGGNGFGLNLRYEGKLYVDGTWESPHVVLFSAGDEYSALKKYSDHLYAENYVARGKAPCFDWWREPIFCGWGQQSCLSYADDCGRKAPSYATQADYERFEEQLAQRNLDPGIVIIDDKWQETYGDNCPDKDKWPDLAGFIAVQHKVGRRVLLWWKAWDPEGVPPEECILDAHGQPLAVDPANAAYERRLRRQVRMLLGELGADGFKLDFTANLPLDSAHRNENRLWGVELLRRLLWIIHSEAKTVKEDALIIAHTVNPYFADIVDMVRLNDIAILPGQDGYAESMIHRKRVTEAVSDNWLIDTDNWPSPTLTSWLEYVRLQPELGVPSLYYITHIDESGEEIGGDVAREIAALWAKYRSRK